ncbi:MAG: hypothetical protein L0Y54_03585, partial [Sporichthyaceae bacterium]|nr:hypothetical protein [Sporichthyaceae bacterium]
TSVVLAECDPFGGDLALRLRGPGHRPLAHDRGMVSLASAVRHDAVVDSLVEHLQVLEGGLPVLIGPRSPRNATAMATTWALVGQTLAGVPHTDVIADCGRLVAGSESSQVVAWADLVVVLTPPTLEGVAHVLQALETVTSLDCAVGTPAYLQVVVVAEPRRERAAIAEVDAALERADAPARVIGTIAHDPAGAAGLRGEWGARLDRTVLIASARRLASRLARLLPPPDLVRVDPHPAAAPVPPAAPMAPAPPVPLVPPTPPMTATPPAAPTQLMPPTLPTAPMPPAPPASPHNPPATPASPYPPVGPDLPTWPAKVR